MAQPGCGARCSLYGSAFFNLLKSLLGIGLLTFPFGFSLTGLPLAVITTLCVVALVRISIVLLLWVDDILDERVRSGSTSGASRTYPVIVQLALSARAQGCDSGQWLYFLTLFTIVVGQFGTCIGYLAFIGTNLTQLFPTLSFKYAVIAAAAAALPVSMVPRIRALYPVSVLGMLALFAAIIAFGIYCGDHSSPAQPNHAPALSPSHDSTSWTTFKWGGLFRFAGIALFAAEGITAIPSVKTSLRVLGTNTTAAISRLIDLSLLTMTCFLLFAGIFGWQCLGEHPPSIVTKALSPTGFTAQFVRASLSLYIMCSYPLQLFPAVEAIEACFVSADRTDVKYSLTPAWTPHARRSGSDAIGTLDTAAGSEGDYESHGEGEVTEATALRRSTSSSSGSTTKSAAMAGGGEAVTLDLNASPPLDAGLAALPFGAAGGGAGGRGTRTTTQPAGPGTFNERPNHGKAKPMRVTDDVSRRKHWGASITGFCCGGVRSTSAAHEVSPLCTFALRGCAVALTALVASQLTQFGVFLSFMGWMAFGILSFIVPPIMYLTLVTHLFGHRPDALARGEHWSAWKERLRGVSVEKIHILSEVFTELEKGLPEFYHEYRATGVRQPLEVDVKVGVVATATSSSALTGTGTAVLRAPLSSPCGDSTRPASEGVPSMRGQTRSTSPLSRGDTPSPGTLAAHAVATTRRYRTGCCGAKQWEGQPLAWWQSVWFWEQAGLYVYIVGGTLVTLAGMTMVILEAKNDSQASDHVGAHA